ncbi:hypothetical protein LWI29_029518 [Acer saccharum]|uniref:Uncharacterized protein n=1 Tax=Acer saccharum TaxID=4024 RepID=A0AA39RTF6_ACESA|nr:hypothetical protein LWI29_029518 [Acer saccharum]
MLHTIRVDIDGKKLLAGTNTTSCQFSVGENIKFSASTDCVQSTVWKLDSHDDSLRQWFVTTGGVEGKSWSTNNEQWFKIEKFDDDYKLVSALRL